MKILSLKNNKKNKDKLVDYFEDLGCENSWSFFILI